MSSESKSIIVNGRVNIRVPVDAPQSVQSLMIRNTDVIRVKKAMKISISILEPSEGDALIFGSITSRLNVSTATGSFCIESETPVATSSPVLTIGSSEPCDIYIAVIAAFDVEDIGLSGTEIGRGIVTLPSNSDLFIPYLRALDNFLDRTVAPRVTLSPWSTDLIFLMGRGLLDVAKSKFGESHASLVARAKGMIFETYRDPRTNPSRIAAMLGVSLRTLQRRFAEEGISVTDEIRSMRVQAARDFLAQVPRSGSSVRAAARESGFGSVVSLRRALRSEGGAANTRWSDSRRPGAE